MSILNMSGDQQPLTEGAGGGQLLEDIPRLGKGEFEEAFEVFQKQGLAITRDNLPLFLKSIGLHALRGEIEDKLREQQLTEVDEPQLKSIINEVLSTSDLVTSHTNEKWEWPSNDDVITAFSVFDQEGLGFIPVQQLKRFLLQAQLGFQEEELEKIIHGNCKIDNDNQINYEEFVLNVRDKLQQISTYQQ